jgi:hypothetical protein
LCMYVAGNLTYELIAIPYLQMQSHIQIFSPIEEWLTY